MLLRLSAVDEILSGCMSELMRMPLYACYTAIQDLFVDEDERKVAICHLAKNDGWINKI